MRGLVHRGFDALARFIYGTQPQRFGYSGQALGDAFELLRGIGPGTMLRLTPAEWKLGAVLMESADAQIVNSAASHWLERDAVFTPVETARLFEVDSPLLRANPYALSVRSNTQRARETPARSVANIERYLSTIAHAHGSAKLPARLVRARSAISKSVRK